jgi:hypothetical protein
MSRIVWVGRLSNLAASRGVKNGIEAICLSMAEPSKCLLVGEQNSDKDHERRCFHELLETYQAHTLCARCLHQGGLDNAVCAIHRLQEAECYVAGYDMCGRFGTSNLESLVVKRKRWQICAADALV